MAAYFKVLEGKVVLTPLEIHNKEFRKSFRGYNEVEVDEFLDQVVKDFEEVLRDNAGLKAKLEDFEAQVGQYKSIEDTLNNTLVVAQQTAEDVKAAAKQEAGLIIERANAEASKIVEAGHNEARAAMAEFENYKRQMQVFKARMKSIVKSYSDLLDGVEEDLDATKVV